MIYNLVLKMISSRTLQFVLKMLLIFKKKSFWPKIDMPRFRCFIMAAPSANMKTGMNVESDQFCTDWLQFQETLKKMRAIDDKIIYELNNTIPTDYFAKDLNITQQCKCFYEQLHRSHQERDSIISRCITEASARVNQKKKEQQKDRDDLAVLNVLRKEQTKLRLVKQEVNIEEVIKDRTIKAYYERCRNAYKPPLDKPPVV